jgi:hypothetical protein
MALARLQDQLFTRVPIMSKSWPLFRPVLASIALAIMLSGCAADPHQVERDSQRQAAYAAAAGPSVRTFRFFGPLYSWEPLGNDQLVVYTRPKEAWLLDVAGCPNLSFTSAIGLTSNMHEVTVMLDHVLTGRRDYPCTITQARPLDIVHLKATQQAQRRIEERARETPVAH